MCRCSCRCRCRHCRAEVLRHTRIPKNMLVKIYEGVVMLCTPTGSLYRTVILTDHTSVFCTVGKTVAVA